MRIKVKLSKVSFYDYDTKQMFEKTFAGSLTHRRALEMLQPVNKTTVVNVEKYSQVFEVDDLKLYDFLTTNGTVMTLKEGETV